MVNTAKETPPQAATGTSKSAEKAPQNVVGKIFSIVSEMLGLGRGGSKQSAGFKSQKVTDLQNRVSGKISASAATQNKPVVVQILKFMTGMERIYQEK